eukprot:ctg_601.g166
MSPLPWDFEPPPQRSPPLRPPPRSTRGRSRARERFRHPTRAPRHPGVFASDDPSPERAVWIVLESTTGTRLSERIAPPPLHGHICVFFFFQEIDRFPSLRGAAALVGLAAGGFADVRLGRGAAAAGATGTAAAGGA